MKQVIVGGMVGAALTAVLMLGGFAMLPKADAAGGACVVVTAPHAGFMENMASQAVAQGYSIKAAGQSERDASMWAIACK